MLTPRFFTNTVIIHICNTTQIQNAKLVSIILKSCNLAFPFLPFGLICMKKDNRLVNKSDVNKSDGTAVVTASARLRIQLVHDNYCTVSL